MPLLFETTIRLIKEAAQIPSFSSYEERLHPWIEDIVAQNKEIKVYDVGGNNKVIYVKGSTAEPKVALTAHLDKINHFGEKWPERLPVEQLIGALEGQLDDAAGVGICMAMSLNIRKRKYPTFLVLLSEMEESSGLKNTPHLLKNNGVGFEQGIGARRISDFLKVKKWVPDAIITIDTTPMFKGASGVALYPAHWVLNGLQPGLHESEKTEELVRQLRSIEPDLLISNNTNDYLVYGREFSGYADKTVVSVALEPAIYPYHQQGERVFLKDIRTIVDILDQYLNTVAEKS